MKILSKWLKRLRHRRSGYEDLVAAVREFDQEAAGYLERDAMKLEGFRRSHDLKACFLWERTPQRWAYWAAVYDTLHKRGYYNDNRQ